MRYHSGNFVKDTIRLFRGNGKDVSYYKYKKTEMLLRHKRLAFSSDNEHCKLLKT